MHVEGKTDEENLASSVKAMEDLVDEALQVFELESEKTNVIDDLYNSLKTITAHLSFSVDIAPKILNLPETYRIILTHNMDLLIIRPNFKSEIKRFDQLTLDETSNVIKYAIPSVISMARSDRHIIGKKIAFLREGTKKLKRLPSTSPDEMIISDTTVQIERVEDQ